MPRNVEKGIIDEVTCTTELASAGLIIISATAVLKKLKGRVMLIGVELEESVRAKWYTNVTYSIVWIAP